MWAKLSNNTILTYPYSFDGLRNDYPNTSFPREMTEESLLTYDVVVVDNTPLPDITDTQKRLEVNPTFNGTRWVQTWQVVDLTQEELDRRLAIKRADMVATARQIRLALYSMGMLDTVEAAINAATKDYQLNWEYATVFYRDNTMIEGIAAALNIDDATIDTLFLTAIAID